MGAGLSKGMFSWLGHLYSPMIGFILAAGLSRRFNGFPKQLLVCDGETLLARQLRLFKKKLAALWTVTHREELWDISSRVLFPKDRRLKACTLKSTIETWALYTCHEVLILHGDVYFTDAAANLVVSEESDRPMFFGRGNEMYAMRIPPTARAQVIEAVDLLLDHTSHTVWDTESGLSHLEVVCQESGLNPKRYEITDATQDFDTPESYEAWCKGNRNGS